MENYWRTGNTGYICSTIVVTVDAKRTVENTGYMENSLASQTLLRKKSRKGLVKSLYRVCRPCIVWCTPIRFEPVVT